MWDNRFHIVTSKSNPKLHEFYRAYFDKPAMKKQERILLSNKQQASYPNLKDSLDKFSSRFPKPEKRNKKTFKELGWDSNFHVKVSKDNEEYYKSFREYFDSPLVLNYKKGSISRRSQMTSREKFIRSETLSMEKYY